MVDTSHEISATFAGVMSRQSEFIHIFSVSTAAPAAHIVIRAGARVKAADGK